MARSRRRPQLACTLTALALLGVVGPARAGVPRRSLDQLVVRRWTTEDGLPQGSVTALAQTRDGYLWAGTFGGLARFDGLAFTVFGLADGLPSTRILALFEDSRGTLWVGTEDAGVARLRVGERRFAAVARPPRPSSIWAFGEDAKSGRLWVGSGMGLLWTSRDEPGELQLAAGVPAGDVVSLARDRAGVLWVGTRGGLARASGDRFEIVELGSAAATWVLAVLADPAGGVLVHTRGGLLHVDGGTAISAEPRSGPTPSIEQVAPPLAAVEMVGAALADHHGRIWLGSHGLARFAGGELEQLVAPGGTSRPTVRALLEDREGDVWVGFDGGGLLRLREGDLATFAEEHGLPPQSLLSVTEGPDGTVWVAASCSGIYRSTDGGFTPVMGFEGKPLGCVQALLFSRRGTLYAGESGLLAWDGQGWRRFGAAEGLVDEHVEVLFEDRAGALWVGTPLGLQRFAGRRFEAPVAGLVDDAIESVAQAPDGTVWVGTRRGLTELAGSGPRRYTVEEGLAPGPVRALHFDGRGVLWVGTYGGGLARIAGGSIQRYGRTEGLEDDVVSTILEDDHLGLWTCGNRGISRLRRDELDRVADGTARRLDPHSYGVGDGMRNRECVGGSQPAGWRDRRGRLWFPTIEGVVMADPANERRNPVPPAMVIQGVVAGGEELPVERSVRLRRGVRRVEVHYAGLSFAAPERVRHRYRLEGFDSTWIEAGTRRTAYYTNVPPGTYRFRVEAANEDGVWSKRGATVELTFPPRFYQTAWFSSLWVLLGACALWGGYDLRVRRLRAREATLSALVVERTRQLVSKQEELAQLNENLAAMVAEQTQELRQTRDVALLTLARLAELRDGTTGQHIERIGAYSRRLAEAASQGPYGPLDPDWIALLEHSSRLHDIGKIAVPDVILRKAGPLDPAEWAIMRRHVQMGGDTLRSILEGKGATGFLHLAMEIAYNHHERWDGSGYPAGLSGPAIPLSARIVAVADTYDAITSERPYKPPLAHDEAVRRIVADRGRHFDPVLVDAFLAVADDIRRLQQDLENCA